MVHRSAIFDIGRCNGLWCVRTFICVVSLTTPDNRLLDPFFTDSGDFTGKLCSKETGDLVFSVDGCYVKPNPDMNVSAIPRKE